jgi:glycosyltransferase involved in cell wall biosynthesis
LQRQLKILYHHRVASKDGQAVHIAGLIDAFRELGHRVEIVAPPGYAETSFGGESGRFSRMKRYLPKAVYELLELAYNIPIYRRLKQCCTDFRPDLIYERYNLFVLAGIILRRRRGSVLFLEINSPLARERSQFGGLALPGIAGYLERWVWRNADRVLPVTEVLANIARDAGVPSERISVISNGINLKAFQQTISAEQVKATLGLTDRTVLGFTGFMRNWHGLDRIITILANPAFRLDIHLLLVGDGPERPALAAQIERLGLASRVTFTGVVDRAMIADYVGAFDIALQPRAVEYASPLKLFEYMALAKPIVAPDQPNIREVLTHDLSALLFEPASDAALAHAILRLAADPLLRARLGSAARQQIADRGLTWKEHASRVAALAVESTPGRASPAPASGTHSTSR